MYCSNCGTWNDSRAQYCRGCGSVLREPARRSGVDASLVVGVVIIMVGLVSSMGLGLVPAIGDSISGFGQSVGEWGSSFGRFMADWGTSFGEFMSNWGQNFGRVIRDSVRSLATLSLLLGLLVIGYIITTRKP